MAEYKLAVVGAEGVGTDHPTHKVTSYWSTTLQLKTPITKQVVIYRQGDVSARHPGHSRDSAMRDQYMRTGEGFLIVFAIYIIIIVTLPLTFYSMNETKVYTEILYTV